MPKYVELIKIFSRYKKNQIGLFFLGALSIIINLFFVYQIQDFVDLITAGTTFDGIWKSFFRIFGIGCASLVIGIWQNQMWHVFRYTVMNYMRTIMYQKLLMKKAIFYDEHTTGEIVSAVMNDATTIAESAGISVLMLFLNSIQVVIILVVLIWKNMTMGAIVMLLGALYFAAVNRINHSMRENYKEYSQEVANVNQHLNEDMKAILEIKALNEKLFFEERFHNHVWKKFFTAAKKVIHLDVMSYGVNNFISVIFPVLMVLIGGIFMYQGKISIGVVILFYTYSQKLIEPLNNLSDFYRGTQVAVGAANRIYEYLADKNEQDTRKVETYSLSLDINIQSFAWNTSEKEIIHGVKETYHGGDRVFIQGESGKGKSTLLKLICGFYPVTQGAISINGQNVNRLPESELFQLIKIQFQEPVILEGSLRENIALGNTYSDEQIYHVLELVLLDQFVKEHGLDYKIGEAGKNLSGGQKQRLALARILIRKPRILILDEATNGLDQGTEEQLIQNILKYVEQTQSIFIVTSHKALMKEICNRRLIL